LKLTVNNGKAVHFLQTAPLLTVIVFEQRENGSCQRLKAFCLADCHQLLSLSPPPSLSEVIIVCSATSLHHGVLEATNLAVKVVYNSIKVSALLPLLFPVVKEPCQNSIREEIKSRLKSRNACYYSVQCLLSSSLLSKNVNIKICKTIILPVVLYGCEPWSLTLREECRLRVSEKSVFRKIFGPKKNEVIGEWRRLHNVELNYLYC